MFMVSTVGYNSPINAQNLPKRQRHMACPSVFDSECFPALPRVPMTSFDYLHISGSKIMSDGSQGREEGLHLRHSPLELMCHLLELSSSCSCAAAGKCDTKPGEEGDGAWTSTPQSGSTGSKEDSGKLQFGSSLDLFGSESNSAETSSRETGNVQESSSLERSLGKRRSSSLDLFASSSEQTATTSESKNVSHPQKRVRFDLLTSSISQDNEHETSSVTTEKVEANGHITTPISQPKDVLDMFKLYLGSKTLRGGPDDPYRMGRVFRMVVNWGSVKEGEDCITRAKWYV